MSKIEEKLDNLTQAIDNIDLSLSELKKYPKDINLLSVNATIQAVHAKELGKGFSIVAKEMGLISSKLSKQLDLLSLEVSFYKQEMEYINNVKNKKGIHFEKKNSM